MIINKIQKSNELFCKINNIFFREISQIFLLQCYRACVLHFGNAIQRFRRISAATTATEAPVGMWSHELPPGARGAFATRQAPPAPDAPRPSLHSPTEPADQAYF